MSDSGASAPTTPKTFQFEFLGSGGEYFGIWIVNLALTVLTLGIYSAWATLRTRRYFRGNTVLAGHSFDYHASPVRILIGRAIAVGLLVSYNLSVSFSPYALLFWLPLFLVVLPWLINSSLRFNARNTSYRNVRFNFTGRYGQALKAYILWPILGFLTLGFLMPLARRVADYYWINHHTFGGRPFETKFSIWRIYAIFLIGLGLSIALVLVVGGLAAAAFAAMPHGQTFDPKAPGAFMPLFILAVVLIEVAFITLGIAIATMVFNLAVSNTILDGRHKLGAKLSPARVAWIVITNVVLTMLTLGIFYPWAQVRIARYRVEQLTLEAASDLDEFTSEAFGTQSAVGEEIAGFFDLDFGL
jgi:uncharacterized membrane protein YjgN (DUF898 family)